MQRSGTEASFVIFTFSVSPFYVYPIRGRAGAVASVADYGPRGPGFDTWPGRRSFLP